MATMTINKRALRNEAAWLPRTMEDAALVASTLISAGVPNQVANAIVGWLVAKTAGLPDRTSDRTRSAYRKVLADLESPLECPASTQDIPGYFNDVEWPEAA